MTSARLIVEPVALDWTPAHRDMREILSSALRWQEKLAKTRADA